MIFYNPSIEGKKDFFGRTPILQGVNFKKYNFGLFKIWKAYHLYYLPYVVVDGILYPEEHDRYLKYIEIKWAWK